MPASRGTQELRQSNPFRQSSNPYKNFPRFPCFPWTKIGCGRQPSFGSVGSVAFGASVFAHFIAVASGFCGIGSRILVLLCAGFLGFFGITGHCLGADIEHGHDVLAENRNRNDGGRQLKRQE